MPRMFHGGDATAAVREDAPSGEAEALFEVENGDFHIDEIGRTEGRKVASGVLAAVDLAERLYREQKDTQASELLDGILAENQTLAFAALLRSRAHVEALEFRKAFDVLTAAFDAAPEDPELGAELVWLGLMFAKTGNRLAIELMERVVEFLGADEEYLRAAHSVLVEFENDKGIEASARLLLRVTNRRIGEITMSLAQSLWRQERRRDATQVLASAMVTASHDAKMFIWKTTRQYCEEKKLRYEVFETPNVAPAYLPRVCGESYVDRKLDVYHPPWYLAVLSNVTVLGGVSSVLTDDGHALNDSIAHPRSRRFRYRSSTFFFTDAVGACIAIQSSDPHRVPRGIMMSGGASGNYSHWLVEFLPRMHVLNRYPEFDDFPFLIDEASAEDPHFIGLLDRLDERHRPRIVLKSFESYRVEELICPSRLSAFPIHIQPGLAISSWDVTLPKAIVTTLRGALVAPRKVGRRKIYLVRGASARNVTNEDEVIEILRSFDFEFIRPETLTLDEKLEVFGDAGIIFGSGSGLTNIVFSPPQTSALAHVSSEWRPFTFFPTLVEHIGGYHETIVGEDVEIGLHVDYRIDPGQLRRMLAKHVDRLALRLASLDQVGPQESKKLLAGARGAIQAPMSAAKFNHEV